MKMKTFRLNGSWVSYDETQVEIDDEAGGFGCDTGTFLEIARRVTKGLKEAKK